MKKSLLYINIAFFLLGSMSFADAQENSSFESEFAPIDAAFSNWDAVRGKWLGSSLKAMSANQPIPDRTFPEDFSPIEMMRMVPASTMNDIRSISQNQSQNSRDLLARDRWSKIYSYTNRPACNLVMGRTYGDPHLKSYDGATYSFQTVGEFVLSNANNGQFEVQVRQEPQRDDFSLNTAVAMSVGGDRVGIYARDKRDAFNSPVILNGMPVDIGSRTYYLPHGGTILNSGKNYLVTWPTGEKVSIDMSSSSGMQFMNVAVQIYPCGSNNFTGLMGNANGVRNDDFDTDRNNNMGRVFAGGSNSDQFEKERLAFLAKDFANAHRVTTLTSLFDYGFGENTMTYTDYTYPRVHRTINDIPANRRTNARNICQASGLTGNDLDACIYDQAYLEIEPVRPPVIRDRTDRVTMSKVDREVPNVNPPRVVPTSGNNTRETPSGSISTKPIKQDSRIDNRDSNSEGVEPVRPKWDSREVQSRDNGNTGSGALPRPSSNPTNTDSRESSEGTISKPSSPTIKTERPISQPKPQPPVVKPKPRVVPPKEAPKSGGSVKTAPTPQKTSRPVTPKKVTPAPSPTPTRKGG